jgi:4a-hydroxytetrahydrobiopterin dehydratase
MTTLGTAELRAARCRPLGAAARLDATLLAAQLAAVPAWSHADGALQRDFRFADFHRTMAFVNALAWIAHTEDHHPELLVSYGGWLVRWNTHSAGGVTVNDFTCAAKANALLPDDAR